MGIKKLKAVLRTSVKKGIYKYPTVIDFLRNDKSKLYSRHVKLNKITNPILSMKIKQEFDNKPYYLGIDASLYCVRYKRVFDNLEYGFLKQILSSLAAGIIPVYVFDGVAPESKKKTLEQRKQRRINTRTKLDDILDNDDKIVTNNFNIDQLIDHANNLIKRLENITVNEANDVNILYSENDIDKMKKKITFAGHSDITRIQVLLNMLHIPFLVASGEADDTLAIMYKNGLVNACQSDDMDLLPKGCGNLIQIDNNGVTQYVLHEILECLGLDHNQFVDLCILLGSEYYRYHLSKINHIELFELFKKNSSIELFVQYYKTYDKNIVSHLDGYTTARQSFLDLDGNVDDAIINTKLEVISLNVIKSYLDSINVRINDSDYYRFGIIIKNVNKFITQI